MMQRLELDFCATRRASPWIGRLALAAGVFVAADVGMAYQAAQEPARAARPVPAAAPAAKASAQEVAAVRETVERLSLPWDELFGALEAAASDRVALAAIEPDAKAGTVTISGEGKDYLAALSYVFNLSRAESLERVQLARHEQKPQGTVSFTVSAAWAARQ